MSKERKMLTYKKYVFRFMIKHKEKARKLSSLTEYTKYKNL